MQRQTHSSYADLIANPTGGAFPLLPVIETIMREDIFHSTLDWQSPAQFRAGAREAYALFLAHPELYPSECTDASPANR